MVEFMGPYTYVIAGFFAGVILWHIAIGDYARKVGMANILSRPFLHIIKSSGRMQPVTPDTEVGGHWEVKNFGPWQIENEHLVRQGRTDHAWAHENEVKMIAPDIAAATTILNQLGYEVDVKEGDELQVELTADELVLDNPKPELKAIGDKIEINLGRRSIDWNSLAKYIAKPETPQFRDALTKSRARTENWDFSGSGGIRIDKTTGVFILIIILAIGGFVAAKFFGFI